MSILEVIAVLVTVAGIVLLSRLWDRVSASRLYLRRRVLVNLSSGRTFGGVLWGRAGDWLVLRNAEMIERGREAVPVDGEVVLDTSAVEFVQVL